MKRTPNEILAVLDFAQEILDKDSHNAFDLRGLLWEVIADVIDSAALAANQAVLDAGLAPIVADALADEVAMTTNNYVANNYGDD